MNISACIKSNPGFTQAFNLSHYQICIEAAMVDKSWLIADKSWINISVFAFKIIKAIISSQSLS